MDALRKRMAFMLVIALVMLPVFTQVTGAESGNSQLSNENTTPLASYSSSDDKDRLEILGVEKQQQDTYYLGITLRFTYHNPKDSMECSSFSKRYTLTVFQNDVACSPVYITGYYSKQNADTLVRNGASVLFNIRFTLEYKDAPYEIVIIPTDADNSKDYFVYKETST